MSFIIFPQTVSSSSRHIFYQEILYFKLPIILSIQQFCYDLKSLGLDKKTTLVFE